MNGRSLRRVGVKHPGNLSFGKKRTLLPVPGNDLQSLSRLGVAYHLSYANTLCDNVSARTPLCDRISVTRECA